MNLSVKKKINILEVLSFIMIARFSCTVLSNIPIFSMDFIFVYGVAFIGILLISYRTMERNDFIGLFWLLVYTFYVFVVTADTGIFNTQAFNAYVMVFLYFLYLYFKKADEKFTYKMRIVALVGYIFTAVYSIPLLINDPDLARKTAASLVEEGTMGVLNFVATFDTVYGFVILLVMMIYLRNENISRRLKNFLTLSIIIGVVFLVLSSYATAILLMIFAFALILYRKNKLWAFIIVFLVVLFMIFSKPIGELMYDFADTIEGFDTLENKIKDVATMLITGESAGTLAGDDGRIARMKWSIDTFKNYPIFGGFGKGKVGAHSELFDVLARFGLVGTIPLICFWVTFFKSLYREIATDNGRRCFWSVVIMHCIISILDPSLFIQQIFPFFIVFPFFAERNGADIETEKNKRHRDIYKKRRA